MSALRTILPTRFTNTKGLIKYTPQVPKLPIEALRYYSALDAAADYAPTQEVLSLLNRGTGSGSLTGVAGSAPKLLAEGDRSFLRFDGVNDTMATAVSDTAAVPKGGSFTMWAVARYPATPAQNFSPIFMAAGGSMAMSMSTSRSMQSYRWGMNPTSLARAAAIDDGWHVFLATFNASGLSAIRVDDAETTLATSGADASPPTIIQVGVSTAAGKFVEIDIMALGTHAKALTPEERVIMVDALRASYLQK